MKAIFVSAESCRSSCQMKSSSTVDGTDYNERGTLIRRNGATFKYRMMAVMEGASNDQARGLKASKYKPKCWLMRGTAIALFASGRNGKSF